MALQILEAHAARLLAAQPPLDCQGLQMLAELSLQRGALQPYLHYTRRLAELRPEQRDTVLLEACAQVAGFYGERGDVDRHLDWLTRAVRRAPRDAAVLLRLADAEWTSGRTCAAVEHYRTVLELEPEHAARPRIAARLADFPHPAAPVP